jgi:hypothetical protein
MILATVSHDLTAAGCTSCPLPLNSFRYFMRYEACAMRQPASAVRELLTAASAISLLKLCSAPHKPQLARRFG